MSLIKAKDIGSRIKGLRMARGLTQEAVAEGLGINSGYYSHLENGKRLGSVDLFVLLSDYFNVTLDYLIKGVEELPNGLGEGDVSMFRVLSLLSDRQKKAVTGVANIILDLQNE